MHTLHKFLIFHLLAYLGRNADGSEIINGDDAAENSMPYMAAMFNNTQLVCGGFLIRDNFVLTAAHCHDSDVKYVVLGTNNVHSRDGVKIEIDRTIKHESCNTKNLGNGYDIMLLKLRRKVELGHKIQTIHLSTTEVRQQTKCMVAGWGATRSGGGVIDDLKVVTVSVIGLNYCKSSWGNLPQSVICAGGDNTGKGFCQGDSGGPLVCNGKAVGVVSFNDRNKCDYSEGTDVPNVYTDVSKYRDWIHRKIKANE